MKTKNLRNSNIIPEIADPLRDKADILYLKKGQLLYQEGNTPLGAYFVKEGSAKIYKIGSLGKEQILKIVSKGEILNFPYLLSSFRFRSSAQTIEDSSFFFIPKQDFWDILQENHDIFWKLMTYLSLEITSVEDKVVDLAYKPVRGRLADAIIALVQKLNDDMEEAPTICLTRNDLAGYVGTVRETINRLLAELRNDKIISIDGKCITIKDWKSLERISRMYS